MNQHVNHQEKQDSPASGQHGLPPHCGRDSASGDEGRGNEGVGAELIKTEYATEQLAGDVGLEERFYAP